MDSPAVGMTQTLAEEGCTQPNRLVVIVLYQVQLEICSLV